MGLFGPFTYKNKKGKKFWLHMKRRGRGVLYFFSKEPIGAINSLPKGFKVAENPKTGMPFIKRDEGGLLNSLFGTLRKKETGEEQKESGDTEEKEETEETGTENQETTETSEEQ